MGQCPSEGEHLARGNDDREAPESTETHDDDATESRVCAFDIGLHGVTPRRR